MTHEELLAKIDEHIDYGTCGVCDGKCYKEENIPWLALRAVVELHKPGRTVMVTGEVVCDGCDAGDDYYSDFYPCPTIKAIEKELK